MSIDTVWGGIGIFSFIFTFIFAFSKNETYYATEKVSSNGVFPGESKETGYIVI